VNPPVPVYMDFYFFTVMNPDEVTINGSKPILNEVGPYVYKEVRVKEDLLTVDRDRLQYSIYISYTFDQVYQNITHQEK